MLDLLLGRAGVWLAGMLLLMGSFGTGYLKGKLAEQENQKLELADVLVKRVEVVRTIYKNDGNVSEAYERGKKEREDEFNKLVEELLRSQITVLPASCDFPDDVVRLLNVPRSNVRPSAGSEKPADPMRRATSYP